MKLPSFLLAIGLIGLASAPARTATINISAVNNTGGDVFDIHVVIIGTGGTMRNLLAISPAVQALNAGPGNEVNGSWAAGLPDGNTWEAKFDVDFFLWQWTRRIGPAQITTTSPPFRPLMFISPPFQNLRAERFGLEASSCLDFGAFGSHPIKRKRRSRQFNRRAIGRPPSCRASERGTKHDNQSFFICNRASRAVHVSAESGQLERGHITFAADTRDVHARMAGTPAGDPRPANLANLPPAVDQASTAGAYDAGWTAPPRGKDLQIYI
jgi:hypothetical protein